MQRPVPAALLNAVLVGSLLTGAACADARAAFAFERIPLREPDRHPHKAAYACALAGAGLIGMSFPLATTADRRYGDYLNETRIDLIPGRWDRTVRADHVASGALLAGESLLVTAAWLRFVRHPGESRVAFDARPDRCAVSFSF